MPFDSDGTDVTHHASLILWNDVGFYAAMLACAEAARDREHLADLLRESFDTFGTGRTFGEQFAREMAGQIAWGELADEVLEHVGEEA